MRFFNNKLVRFITTSLVVVALLLVTYGPSEKTPKAQAQTPDGTGIFDAAILGENIISAGAAGLSAIANSASAAALNSLALKEWTLDGIAYGLVNIMIKHISRSIVTWINSGFQGSPAFVTDLEAFLLDVADQEAGAFLTELGLGAMCSPFKLDVQLALAIQYQQARSYEDQCRLSDIVGNVEAFFADNDLSKGGWGGWFSLTTQPGNNPYGALAMAQSELAVRIRNAQGQETTLLNWGEGFLSFETCDEEFGICNISTPGAVIENQLNNTLASGQNRLIVADEINEILGALFSQLVVQTFTGVGGLLGLTASGYTAEGFSYLEAATRANPVAEDDQVGFESEQDNPIEESIHTEEEYLEVQETIITLIDEAEEYEVVTYGTTACTDRTLPRSIRDIRTDALDEAEKSATVIDTLNILNVAYENTDDPTEKDSVVEGYLTLRDAELLHTDIDIQVIKTEVIGRQFGSISTGLHQSLTSFTNSVDADCQAFFDDQEDDEN